MNISSNFDAGNIEVVNASDYKNIQLKIRKDTQSDYFQWFYFRLQDAKGYPCKLSILNAHESSYPEGWEGYKVRASYDRVNWFQIPTTYDGKSLHFELMPKYNAVFFAYFAPFSYEQHLDLVHRSQLADNCILTQLGESVEGRPIDMLMVGEPSKNKKKVWIIARQHPGESMTEWFMKGFIERLLDKNDPASTKLLSMAEFYLVPNMNIDGSIHGNLRANAAGENLNRAWANPDKQKSPEVFFVKQKMKEIGIDINLDIHGDEALPYIFSAGIEGIPSFDERLSKLTQVFNSSWENVSPDFQTVYGYEKNEPGKANLDICSKNIGEEFHCLSQTIEMPFKDNDNLPDNEFGWSAKRSERLGASLVNTLLFTLSEM